MRPDEFYGDGHADPDHTSWWRDTLLNPGHPVETLDVVGRGLVFALLLWWGYGFVSFHPSDEAINATFLHRVDLVFHEAGHIVFSLLGSFMGTAGGTIMQLLIPVICLLTFLIKHQNSFGGAVATWWLGQSLIDCAPYAWDARAQQIMLLGGVTGSDVPGYHDWNNMLGQLGWLAHDHTIAWGLYGSGALLIVGSLAWMAALLWMGWQAREVPVYMAPTRRD
jgi:hypothetical protein